MPAIPPRPRSTLFAVLALWFLFYASFTLFTPPLLDDADSVHAEVAREMLLRHDYVTLHANGIRYLEKAPLLYWSMATSMRVSQLFGGTSPRALAAAVRIPLALAMLALTLLCEAFARRLATDAWAGLYAALIVLSSFGLFIYSHITLPDAMVCLWLALALYAFWQTEHANRPDSKDTRRASLLFAFACALNVLTKGLIGVVFPVGIVLVYLLLTRDPRGTLRRLTELHPIAATLLFLAVAAPWHIAAGLANPAQGHPAPFRFTAGHWQVPLPTDGNVRGWFWFYFMNEHVLRYLNLRVPRDYDTVPLWLFWGLCFVWIMPWSAFALQATRWAVPLRTSEWRSRLRRGTLDDAQRGSLLLAVAVAVVLLFFSLSTRQEYYVLPALPAAAVLLGGSLAQNCIGSTYKRASRTTSRVLLVLLIAGSLFAFTAVFFLLRTSVPVSGTQLSDLLAQNPGDYALSMGHFLDLKARALGMFHLPLALVAAASFLGPLGAHLLHRSNRPHASTLALAAGTFVFLLAADSALILFSPTLSSAQLAEAIAPQVHAGDLVAIHGEYEAGSTLGFYLQRSDIHILEGRSSNLWYGSFFPDAPRIFESRDTLARKWLSSQRIFLWQDQHDTEHTPFQPPGPSFVIASSEGKQILSNQPNR